MTIKKIILTVTVLLTGTAAYSQNWEACDSLTINCCTHNTAGPNTVVLEVSNASSVLFDYPGFILFDSNMDTIAIETVNYFGIGTGFQQHIMNLVAPLPLPFTGTLNLYTLFYVEQACSWPVTLPDTTTGLTTQQQPKAPAIYPNPVSSNTQLILDGFENTAGPITILISDTRGRYIKSLHLETIQPIDVKELEPGVYFLKINCNGGTRCLRFLKL
jgi:hypothetical protein